MISIPLRDNLVFHDDNPYAEPLFVDQDGRILRFTLKVKVGQSVQEHTAPHSPVYNMVPLKGSGLFSGGDKKEQRFGPGALLVFDRGEMHTIRAEDEELILVAFMHAAPQDPWHTDDNAP
jgi:quercetin dioxygenase-like cupin family protein